MTISSLTLVVDGLKRLIINGTLKLKNAPTEGSFEKYTHKISYDSKINTDYVNCTLCNQNFKENEEISQVLKTNTLFHSCCLQDWFKISPNCPLTRISLNEDDEFTSINKI
jgi:hypothetical protein